MLKMKSAVAVVIAVMLCACTDADTAHRALEEAGYSKVETTGYKFFGCGESDTFRTGFTATGAKGRKVEGVVCSGVFKGATIRTF